MLPCIKHVTSVNDYTWAFISEIVSSIWRLLLGVMDKITFLRKCLSFRLGSPKATTIATNVSYNVAALGEHVAVQCSSMGFPQPVCRLYHKANLLNVNGSVYVIHNFTAADEGVYTCNCSNVAGVEEANLTLSLYG